MSTLSAVLPLAGTDLVQPVADGWQLILAALLGIALIVVLITVVKVHPFLALIAGAFTVGALGGAEHPRRPGNRHGRAGVVRRRASAQPPPAWAS